MAVQRLPDARLELRALAESAFMDALARLGGEAHVGSIADVLHKDRSAIQRTAKRLADQGRLIRRIDPPRVLYRLKPAKPDTDTAPTEDWQALDAVFAKLSRLRA